MKQYKITNMNKRLVAGIIIFCIILILVGAFLKVNKSSVPPELYIKTDNANSIKCVKGGFNWNHLGRHTVADALHPTQMNYDGTSTIFVNPNQTLKLTNSENYRMYVENIKYYDRDLNEIKIDNTLLPKVTSNNEVSIVAPNETGIYILTVDINYYNKGTVQYGIKVIDNYDVSKLKQYEHTYVGDNVKVSQILNLLPYNNYKNGIELTTSKKPYGLTVNYSGIELTLEKLELNTLSLFTLIDNLDQIMYNVQNNDKLETLIITREQVQNYDLTIEGLNAYINGK